MKDKIENQKQKSFIGKISRSKKNRKRWDIKIPKLSVDTEAGSLTEALKKAETVIKAIINKKGLKVQVRYLGKGKVAATSNRSDLLEDYILRTYKRKFSLADMEAIDPDKINISTQLPKKIKGLIPYYTYSLHYSDEDKAYIVSIEELPGCMTHGSSPAHAMVMAFEAAEGALECLHTQKEAIPEPISKIKDRVFKVKKRNGKWEIKEPSSGLHSKGSAKQLATKMVKSALASLDYESQVTFRGSNDLILTTNHKNVLKEALKKGINPALELLSLSLNDSPKNIQATVTLNLDAEVYLTLQIASKLGLSGTNFSEYANKILRHFLFNEPVGNNRIRSGKL